MRCRVRREIEELDGGDEHTLRAEVSRDGAYTDDAALGVNEGVIADPAGSEWAASGRHEGEGLFI